MERNCPSCGVILGSYDKFFCSSCGNLLPKEQILREDKKVTQEVLVESMQKDSISTIKVEKKSKAKIPISLKSVLLFVLTPIFLVTSLLLIKDIDFNKLMPTTSNKIDTQVPHACQCG